MARITNLVMYLILRKNLIINYLSTIENKTLDNMLALISIQIDAMTYLKKRNKNANNTDSIPWREKCMVA